MEECEARSSEPTIGAYPDPAGKLNRVDAVFFDPGDEPATTVCLLQFNVLTMHQ
jgi:hypothetical protein